MGKELRAALPGAKAQLLALSGDLRRLSGIRTFQGYKRADPGGTGALCAGEGTGAERKDHG